jgi:uncharacterized protein (TIGR02677 family)
LLHPGRDKKLQLDEKLFRQITEVSYLAVENSWRYRSILRYFYRQHEKLRHYLFPDEVYDYLTQSPHFAGYTQEQLAQDLNQLVEWKNLVPRQDLGKVGSIEEFRKKRYRYQCTPYTVEIERLILELENKGDSFGGSLERTLFDRLLASLTDLTDQKRVARFSDEELYARWDEMYVQFRRLTENATDYLAHLESETVEELMQTEAFLVYKDSLTDYLRNFIAVLQRSSFQIEKLLQEVSESFIEIIVGRLKDYYSTIPRLEAEQPPEAVQERFRSQWQSLAAWFFGRDGRESDLSYLQKATTETIRRITRFAQRLGERYRNRQSRRKDYLYLAGWFNRCGSLREARQLYGAVFGVSSTRHLFVPAARPSEDIYSRIWEEEPVALTVIPRRRGYRPRSRPQALVSRKREKEAALAAYLKIKEREAMLLEQLSSKDRIVLGDLLSTDPHIRTLLLGWIGRCMTAKDLTARTQAGATICLRRLDDSRVKLHWDDGILELPNYEITIMD